jgi:hypothetical protein
MDGSLFIFFPNNFPIYVGILGSPELYKDTNIEIYVYIYITGLQLGYNWPKWGIFCPAALTSLHCSLPVSMETKSKFTCPIVYNIFRFIYTMNRNKQCMEACL